MELKQVALNNTGMQQDLSISKESKDFAYKNLNIRIQATSDGTLASITNIKAPKLVIESTLEGIVLNSILCNKYIVVFTHTSKYDYIYRIDLDDSCKVNTLYKGDLNFRIDYPIDSTFYYENDNVQKVYWVDGWVSNNSNTGRKNNYPRVINIITEGERDGSDFTRYDANTNFDFYPEIGSKIPEITVIKNFDVPSELPAGTIQYFVSYFNHNMSETLIVGQSFLYSVDLKTRGINADKTGCAFDITISNVSKDFDYIRLYSVKRTTLNGDIIVNVVKDIKIDKESAVQAYTIQDNGIGQETIDSSQIFFVGGTPLFAKTLTQKDNALFVGGVKTEGVFIDQSVKNALQDTITITEEGGEILFEESGILTEDTKKIPVSDVTFNAYYPYRLQKDNESILFKTFKVGEVYRFGIQFQNKQGQWSEVVWIGDKKIINTPTYNNDSTFNVSNIIVDSNNTSVVQIFNTLKNKGFVNYRLLMADPEYSNGRSILAQGIICPTMFSPSLRTQNNPHTINSWIMRPRNTRKAEDVYQVPCHHLEPLESAARKNSELSTYDPKEELTDVNTGNLFTYHTMPFEFIKIDSSEYTKTKNDINFYIDESIIDLYSPELTDNTLLKGSPKFRIIGCAPLTSNYNNVEVVVDPIGMDLDYTPSVYTGFLTDYKVPDSNIGNINPLYADYIYEAPTWIGSGGHSLASYIHSYYNIHMWQYSGSIVGFDIAEDKVRYPDDPTSGKEVSVAPLQLKRNLFYNHLFSKKTDYLNNYKEYPLTYGAALYKSGSDGVQFNSCTQSLYYGGLDYIHANNEVQVYSKRKDGSLYTEPKKIAAQSPITFESSAHAVFYLGKDVSADKLEILPVFRDEIPYRGIFTGKYSTTSYWKDLEDSETEEETCIKNIFETNLNSVVTKLGASWIDNFVEYGEGTVQDVYDTNSDPKYKTCCVIGVPYLTNQGGDPYQYARQFIVDNYNIFRNYDYTETIQVNQQYSEYIVVMVAETGVLNPPTVTSGLIKKCYWPKGEEPSYDYYTPTNTNITITELSDIELTKVYPFLCGAGYHTGQPDASYYYMPVWENTSSTPVSNYRFASPFVDMVNNKFKVLDLEQLTKFNGEYSYVQSILNTDSPKDANGEQVAYLFIGELYYDIDYSDLYGGYSESAIDKLVWLPISKPTSLNEYVDTTEGDTYYQRWDCLKTFPRTEEDTNQVIDITSFMVETHVNLDERTDPYRATFNTVVRPINFNLFNDVYGQSNNLFSYSTVNNSLLTAENSHQVTWSMTKNILGTVDTWTNLNASNTINLKYPVTKLVNFNNKIIGLTEHSIEVVNFNAKNLVPTDSNTYIELKNSSKVDGTVDFSLDKGTTNPSVLITDSGLYFIEDNENSLMKINYNGEIQNLGTSRMDSWFKDNIVPGNYLENPKAFHFSYDSKQKDVYIGNDTDVIVYNELLNNFTSFVDLQELLALYTYKGATYALAHETNDLTYNDLFELYGGNTYGYGFYGKELPYSIQYRVNPGPYSDKVFTNIELRADLDITKVNSNTSNVKPFDTIQAWNEYQDTGVQPLVYDRLNNLRDKFRTWRAVIPRNKKGDKSTWRDRIRNPWIHLKLDKTDVNGQKLEFHNITVTYME